MDYRDGSPTVDGDSLSELSLTVSQMALTLISAGSVVETLARVVELALTTIEGCDFVGVFLSTGGVVTTPAHTDDKVLEVDALQLRAGEGPCLDAVAQGVIVYAEDLASDPRWPQFAPEAARSGIRSVLSLPLAPSSQEGALNLYAEYPAAFGVVDRAKATVLASLGSLAVSVTHSQEDEERRAENFSAALATRETIGEALGILMERERISADQAFDMLRRASQHLNVKLRQVAQDLVDTGNSPDAGPSRGGDAG